MTTSPPKRRANRFVPFAIFFALTVFLFVGGLAALLYFLFTQYAGVQNIWILLCGAPTLLAFVVLFTLFTLYNRFGRPLEQLFKTINAVEEGDLSARVPVSRSDLFSDLFRRFNKMVGELERAEQQRRNLAADVAHELRTPLHIIQGNLEGILDGVYPPSAEHLNATLEETRLLTRLVNDLQTLSLAESGQLPLHPTRFQMVDLLQDITFSFASQAAAQGVELTARLSDPTLEVTADYDRLNQVISNLIANSLRYTQRGGKIAIVVERGARGERGVRISVEDTGSGIAAEDLPFIFDRFWRADRSRSERAHSGLGLAITRQLVQAHGGTIEVTSQVARGTRFVIELPAEIPPNDRQSSPAGGSE